MGAAESEILTVSRDGVTVEKSFEPDSFPVPAIAFEISSSRDGAATVRLVDVLPEEVDGTDVGFHPDYGDEFWSVEDGEIVFEREFDGGESFTTVYAVREGDLDTIERFLVEPELEAVDPGEEVVGDSSQVVRDVLSGSTESVPGLGDEESDEEEDDEEVEPLNLQDPTGSGSPAGGVAIGDPTTDGENEDSEESEDADDDGVVSGPEIAAPDEGESVAESLAAEIRAGEADEETLDVLRDALGTGEGGGGGTSSAVDARIQRLQTDVSDLRAYTDALEEFIEENGRGRELLEEVRTEVDRLDERLTAAEEHRERVESSVSSVESSVEEVEESVDDVRGSVDVLEGSLADVRESVSGVEDTVQSVEGRVGSLKGTVDGLAGDLSELEEEAATAEDVTELEQRIDSVEEEMAADLEERLGSIEDQLEEMREDIEGFAEFRQRVQSVFGGVGGGDDEEE